MKDAETLKALGYLAVTNHSGACNWASNTKAEHRRFFTGRHVLIFEDNDDAGRKRTKQIIDSLQKHDPASIKIIALPGLADKEDVSDWLLAGHTPEELKSVIEQTNEVSWPNRRKRLKVLNCLELIEKKIPERVFLLEPIM